MSDLGALATRHINNRFVQKTGVWWATNTVYRPGGALSIEKAKVAKKVPLEFGPPSIAIAIDTTGVLTGYVRDGEIPIVGAEVWVFHRATKFPAARTFSNSSGAFSVSGLGKVSNAYFAVAFGPDGAFYGAAIFDILTPV